MREKFLGFDIDLDETMKDGEIRIVNTSMQIELMRMMRARGWTIEMNLLPCVTPLDNPDIGSYSVTFKATIRKNGAEKDLEDWTEELSDVVRLYNIQNHMEDECPRSRNQVTP